jgi:hypothetical protein
MNKEHMQPPFHVKSIFLGVTFKHSRHLPHSVLELHHAETTTSVSELQVPQQAALIAEFPENDDITEMSACQLRGNDNGPHINSINTGTETDPIPKFSASMSIILHPDMNDVYIAHTLTCRTHFI